MSVSLCRVPLLFLCLAIVTAPVFAQIVLQDGADIDMTGSTGSKIVFPDGSMLDTAPSGGGSAPADHGGTSNSVSGSNSFIGGGKDNTVSGNYSSVGAGLTNSATVDAATVSGGNFNTASGYFSTVGGGQANQVTTQYGTVGGGYYNLVQSTNSTIGGGNLNTAGGYYASDGATVAGGKSNVASGGYSTIGGGLNNTAGNSYSTAVGGRDNNAGGYYATVSGGFNNMAGGVGSAVGGGRDNEADGDYSFAIGRRAKIHAAHDNTFLFADGQSEDFDSTASDQFAVRAYGGFRFQTADIFGGFYGAILESGTNSWTSSSSRETKENFTPIDTVDVLEKVAAMPIEQWNYRHQSADIIHIGPYAEDFHEAFGLSGEYNGRVSTLDLDGVSLAAIQGLNEKLEQKQATIDALEVRLMAIEARLADTTK